MKKKIILALDQGTTSSRTLLIDHEGSVIFTAQQEFRQYFPETGWVEHDPGEIWDSQLQTLTDAMEHAHTNSYEIVAAGITNQRETTVVWNRSTGKPIHRAIVWQDRRTSKYCKDIAKTKWKEIIHQKTGLVIDPYFSATKIKWILENVEGAVEMAGEGELMFGTIDSWLLYKLTGGKVHATDPSNASRTMLYNIRNLEWDKEILDYFQIPAGMLPELKNTMDDFGYISEDISEYPIKIAALVGDQQAALFGQGCFDKGMMKNTYGTGCFMVLNTGKDIVYSDFGLLTTIAWKIEDRCSYALEGSIFIGGAVVQWLRDGLEIIRKSADVESLADEVEDNGGVYMVPAFTGLGAPHWDSQARGSIFGITRGTTKAHIAKAAVESIAFQVNDVFQSMKNDLGDEIKLLKVDGGASQNDKLMEFQAQLINTEIERPYVREATALGAAYLAGLHVNFWSYTEELRQLNKKSDYFKPAKDRTGIDEKLKFWKKAVGKSLAWIEEK